MDKITELKKCSGACKQELPRTEFAKNKRRADGLHNVCRKCATAAAKAWRAANPERAKANVERWKQDPANLERKRAGDRAYHEANKEERNAARKKWAEDNHEHVVEWHRNNYAANKDAFRDKRLQRVYGITLAEYDAKLQAQGGHCAICPRDAPGGRGKYFHVDHDHKTGAIRALLCHHCNTLIGLAGDSTPRLEAAIAYLRRHGVTT